jgi:hypothetical protein
VVHHEFKDLPVGDQRTQLVERHSELVKWVVEQIPLLSERFKPYLRIDDLETNA